MSAVPAMASPRRAVERPALNVNYPSPEARAFYFAVCRDAHANLPASWAEQFRNERAMRQHCLIRAGYCTHTDIVCGSMEDALAAAAMVRPSKGNDYVMATAYGLVVTIFEAKSQGTKALPAPAFFELRDRVFDILADMVGVDPVTLLRRAGGAV